MLGALTSRVNFAGFSFRFGPDTQLRLTSREPAVVAVKVTDWRSVPSQLVNLTWLGLVVTPDPVTLTCVGCLADRDCPGRGRRV